MTPERLAELEALVQATPWNERWPLITIAEIRHAVPELFEEIHRLHAFLKDQEDAIKHLKHKHELDLRESRKQALKEALNIALEIEEKLNALPSVSTVRRKLDQALAKELEKYQDLCLKSGDLNEII